MFSCIVLYNIYRYICYLKKILHIIDSLIVKSLNFKFKYDQQNEAKH